MGLNRSEKVKTLLILQTAAESFQTCPEISSNYPHKTTFEIVEMLSFQLCQYSLYM